MFHNANPGVRIYYQKTLAPSYADHVDRIVRLRRHKDDFSNSGRRSGVPLKRKLDLDGFSQPVRRAAALRLPGNVTLGERDARGRYGKGKREQFHESEG